MSAAASRNSAMSDSRLEQAVRSIAGRRTAIDLTVTSARCNICLTKFVDPISAAALGRNRLRVSNGEGIFIGYYDTSN